MVDTLLFHIYEKKTDKPVKVCLSVDELEKLIVDRKMDWKNWEVQPVCGDYTLEDASFWNKKTPQVPQGSQTRLKKKSKT